MPFHWEIRGKTLEIGKLPLIMGIVNVTPDSFSDGGKHFTVERAVEHGARLAREGADILDIGGESTRPGAEEISGEEEIRRVLPVVERLQGLVEVPLSIDTSKAEVARQAVAAGAAIINDVTGLTGDPEMVSVAGRSGAGVVVMHMQGTPRTMQLNPTYVDVVREVSDYLNLRLAELAENGIAQERVVLDPGIGFGKTLEHNVQLLGHLDHLLPIGRPLCLGVSRKGFINRLLARSGNVEEGDFGTAGVLAFALSRGWVQIARVHEVKGIRDALRIFLELEERNKT